jgi:hypothetical protein
MQTLKFDDVASDLTAPIISDADCRVTCPDTRKQERCRKQTRWPRHGKKQTSRKYEE